MKYVLLAILLFVCMLFGWAIRGIVDSKALQRPTMSYGYEEATQLWHRIRVNDRGQIVCAKEEK